MSIFDSLWSKAAAIMDNAVDGVTGDRIRYRHGGVWLGPADMPEASRVIPAFVINVGAARSIDEFDETLGNRWRVKVAVTLLDHPHPTDRLEHPNLGPGLFMPGGSDPENDGRYWLFDVQKASRNG
jgi:hypothetical protein